MDTSARPLAQVERERHAEDDGQQDRHDAEGDVRHMKADDLGETGRPAVSDAYGEDRPIRSSEPSIEVGERSTCYRD